MRSWHPVQAIAFAGLASCLLLGCAEEEPTWSAAEVESAIETYLSDRTDLRVAQMRVNADHIRYEGNRAIASVSIVASDDPQASMKMVYQLELAADGWRVVPGEPAGHLGDGSNPAQDSIQDLPEGHPPVPSQPQSLPPGHPPIRGGDL